MNFRNAIKKPSWRGALIGLICALALWPLNGSNMIRSLDNWAFDECFVLRGSRPTSSKIVIVAIDEQSLQELDRPLMYISPKLARVVNYLHAQGAGTIAIDVLISEHLQDNEDFLPGGPGDVDTLSRAAQRHKRVVFPELIVQGETCLRPLEELQLATEANDVPLGCVNFTIDPDLHVRRQRLRTNLVDARETHFNFALVTYYADHRETPDWLASSGAEFLGTDGRPIPTDSAGDMQVNYVGPPGTIPSIPFHDVLAAADGEKSLDFDWRDAVVMVGLTGPDQPDQFATPYATPSILNLLTSAWRNRQPALMPGVEVHANVLATLSDAQYITTPMLLSTPLLLIVFGVGLGTFFARTSLEAGALVMFAHHWAWKLFSALALWYGHWRVEVVSMLILGMLVYATIFALRWRWIRRTMGLFKSEAIARALEADPGKLDLQGEEREISVLFCDVRNFTTFSEGHSPQQVVRLLNAYFSAIIPEIEAQGGTVNQYIGDGLMVLFGAPEVQPDHACRAVRTGVNMLRQVDALASRWRQLGADDFRIGVGIHTGKVVVGTVGSPRRLDYTAIGDTVNTTARIEAANKELQTELLISEATFRQISRDRAAELDYVGEPRAISVKGKQQILNVYPISLRAANPNERTPQPLADGKT